jgi:uncharacterized damage-inducible protein DinB
MTMTETKTDTSLVPLLKDAAAYNLWANTRMANWLKEVPEALFDQKVASSFPSLRLTLTHIWHVEFGWFASLQNQKVEYAYGQAYEGPIDELLSVWLKQSKELAALVEAMSAEEIHEGCTFLVPTKWPDFEEFTRPRYEVIQHVLHHSGYHRGQVITMSHHLNLPKAPMTDYMYYNLLGRE